MKKKSASNSTPATQGPESLGQTYWQKAGYPTLGEYQAAMGFNNLENINAPRPGMYRNPANNTWQNMPPKNNSTPWSPSGNSNDISSRIEIHGSRNMPGFTPGPLTGTPEPAWGGATRGPESLRWLEWARQNGATQPSQGASRPPMRPGGGPGGADWLNGTVGTPGRPSQNSPLMDYASARPTVTTTSSPQLNKLAADAAAGGRAGDEAKAALTQRAAAGDPQAANTLQTLNVGMVSPQEADRILREDPNKYDRMKRAGQIPGNQKIYDEAVRDAQKMAGSRPSSAASQPRPESRIIQPTSGQNQNISASGSGPRKEPTAGEMAAQMDKQNRAKEMAAQAAQQRAAARKAEENQAARDAAARKMGFPNAAAAEKAGARIGNIGDKLPIGGGGGGRRGGGRGGSGGRGLTAKERNDLAAKRADQAARRVDSRGYADSAYRDYNADAAKWGDTPDQRRKRLEDRGLNPDYDGWKDNPQHRKDLEKAQSLGKHNKRGKWADVPTLSNDKNKPSVPADDAWQYNVPQSDGFGGPIPTPDAPLPQIGPSASASTGGTWRTIDGRKIRIA